MNTKRELMSKSKEELVDKILEIQEIIEKLQKENELIQKENKLNKEKSRKEIEKLKKEIARIKKVSSKPKIKPSESEVSKQNKRKKSSSKKQSKNLVPTETITVIIPKSELPVGAKLKDYQEYTVQEIVTKVKVTLYKIARYKLPNGKIIKAPMPVEAKCGHFGPELKQHVVYQYHQNNVTQNKILEELKDKRISISAGQINIILENMALNLKSEYEEILEAAKQKSDIICVDDTGERHNRENWFCTALQNEFFAYFKTTRRKSRISFLKTMRGKYEDFALNDEAFRYMSHCKLRNQIIDILRQFKGRVFSCEEDFDLFIKEVLLPCYRGVKSLRNIKEAALIGSVVHHGIDSNLILLSDGAGQFNLFRHALCWIHVGRCFKRYIPETNQDEEDLERISQAFWSYYKELDKYSQSPSKKLRRDLEKKFDTIFGTGAKSEELSAILLSIRKKKAELLRIFENPNTPLHNNATESVIRPRVVRRKISNSTRSPIGRESRDIFASLNRTCRKNKISFWNFLGSRIRKDETVSFLPNLIKDRISARSPTR